MQCEQYIVQLSYMVSPSIAYTIPQSYHATTIMVDRHLRCITRVPDLVEREPGSGDVRACLSVSVALFFFESEFISRLYILALREGPGPLQQKKCVRV
jgi:hypothetical protein